jgi:hypothetical protein
MSASQCSKRVPLAPLQQSSSINQGWGSWRDSSGDIVMVEKQRSSGSGLKMKAAMPPLQMLKKTKSMKTVSP